jgi:hypothetical protein
MKKQHGWIVASVTLILLLLAFNYLDFYAASSRSNSNFSLSTARSGDMLPTGMAAPFKLTYQVRGADRLVEPLAEALLAELNNLPAILEAVPVAEQAEFEANTPLLVVEVDVDSFFWTPFYARGMATAGVFFGSEGDVAWQSGDALVLETSPAIKAEGDFTLEDTSWGLVSKPAYVQHMSNALAKSIAEGLQKDVFTLPPGG